MEYLRWLLILAGVAILALLYFSGRPKASVSEQQRALRRPSHPQPDRNSDYDVQDDPLMAPRAGHIQHPDEAAYGAEDEHFDTWAGDTQLSDPYHADTEAFPYLDPDDLDRPADSASAAEPTRGRGIGAALGGLFGRGAPSVPSPRQEAASRPAAPQAQEKIITLHVAAPAGQEFSGPQLYELFEQRGYHYGDLQIFHYLHQGKRVFSIAKMVKPGYFDIDDIDSFQTPGLTLILQLPSQAPANVAFDVLVSEARDLAEALGGRVLDTDFSTLSNQGVQHLRDSVYDFMHQQKTADTALS